MNDLLSVSAGQLAQRIRDRAVTSEAVTLAYLEQIERVNPHVNAVSVLAADALSDARQADADLADGNLRGPLHGVPFTVKDTFDTVGLVSAAGRQIRRQRAPQRDATVVHRMRGAGAILLAKTNCPPNGSGSDTENAVTGRTLNPYNLSHTPGGSSGGEAALIAAGASPIGLGGDTGGGIRVPAAYCGVTALKPTMGRVPNTGAYNQPGGFTDLRTQIGPLARHIEDLLLVLRVIDGPDYVDAGVTPMPIYDPEALSLAELTVGWFPYDPDSIVLDVVANAVGASAQALARAGVQMVENRPLDLIGGARDLDRGWRNMAATRGQDVVELHAAWDIYRTNLLQYMLRYDAILCPADQHPAPPFADRDTARFDYTVPFSLTGYPAAVVRTGATQDDLPLAVQIVSHPWREDIVLALAGILEREFGGWQPPALAG
ncbi:MAG: amidase [Caldilineaceae bacterium]|nr:amidase [Caldilineaceae bacterium]